MNGKKVGLTLGLFSVVMHAFWSCLVLFGAAQGLMDKLYGLHFLSFSETVQEFNFGTAIFLLVVGFIGWYIFGFIFAFIYNLVGKKK